MRRLAAPWSQLKRNRRTRLPNLAHRSSAVGLSDRPELCPASQSRSASPRRPRRHIGNGAGRSPDSLSPNKHGACQVGSSRTRSGTPPPRGTPRRWSSCSPRTTATSPTAAGSGSSFAGCVASCLAAPRDGSTASTIDRSLLLFPPAATRAGPGFVAFATTFRIGAHGRGKWDTVGRAAGPVARILSPSSNATDGTVCHEAGGGVTGF
jgi:hypothetical protein